MKIKNKKHGTINFVTINGFLFLAFVSCFFHNMFSKTNKMQLKFTFNSAPKQ